MTGFSGNLATLDDPMPGPLGRHRARPASQGGATSRGRRGCKRQAKRMRDLAVLRALRFIEAMAGEPFTIRELCREAGASERTLQYAFQDHFGLTPKRYVNAFRLNSVRRDLLAADPATTSVGKVAGRMGFWHSGQFAANYWRSFGELPSDTLRRPANVLINA